MKDKLKKEIEEKFDEQFQWYIDRDALDKSILIPFILDLLTSHTQEVRQEMINEILNLDSLLTCKDRGCRYCRLRDQIRADIKSNKRHHGETYPPSCCEYCFNSNVSLECQNPACKCHVKSNKQ